MTNNIHCNARHIGIHFEAVLTIQIHKVADIFPFGNVKGTLMLACLIA
jgi:hypothetical protein